MIDAYVEYFRAGRFAHDTGKGLGTNPHTDDVDALKSAAWAEGWRYAAGQTARIRPGRKAKCLIGF